MADMKRLEFLGDSLVQLREFPETARKEAGVQLHKVQQGFEPSDWKPMASVGQGVREIRIRDEAGAFRVLYIAKIEDAVYVASRHESVGSVRLLRTYGDHAARIDVSRRNGLRSTPSVGVQM